MQTYLLMLNVREEITRTLYFMLISYLKHLSVLE